MKKIASLVVGVLVLLVATGAWWLATLDPNQHKALIERWASDALGDMVRIGGPISLSRGLTSTLVVNDLRVSRTADADPMITIQRAEVSLVVSSLVFGPLHVRQVAVDTANLDLPLDRHAPTGGIGVTQVPRIDRLTFANVNLRYRRKGGQVLALTFDEAAVTPAADGTTTSLEASGTLASLPLKISGTTGPVAALFTSAHPLPVQIDMALADGNLTLGGDLSLAGDVAYQVDAKLSLPAASKLADTLRLPPVAVAAAAKLQAEGGVIAAKNLVATAGNSDLAGDLSWQAGARAKLSGGLTSKRIDLIELLLRRADDQAEAAADPKHLLPDLPLPTPAGLPLDLDLKAAVQSLDLPGRAVKDMEATISSSERSLDLALTRAKVAGGTVQGRYQAGAGAPADVAVVLNAATVDLAAMFPTPKDGSQLPKDVTVKLDLAGRGADLRTALGTANGSIAIETGAAVLRSKLADMIGRSLFTSIIPGVNTAGRAHVVCAVLDLEAKDGKARSTALVIDGKHTVIGGGGAIDLATGAIDFVLVPKAKEATLAPLVTPVHLGGTVLDPKVMGDAESVLSSAGHLLLGIVNPLSLATPVLYPDRKGGMPCLDPSSVQEPGALNQVGATAAGAVEGAAQGVGSAIEKIGKDAGKLLESVTGQ